MYLHLGQSVVVRGGDVVGIFDLDTSSWSKNTRDFLSRAQREDRVTAVGEDLPKSFVVTGGAGEQTIYLTLLSSATLARRCEGQGVE